MTDLTAESVDATAARSWWPILVVGGAVSLCCLFAAPSATAAVATGVAAETSALGGGVVRVLVSAIAVATIAVAIRAWAGIGGEA